MKFLAIETSCDDTSVALYDDQHGLLAHQTGQCLENHQAYGGIMPEVASRDHQALILPIIKKVLQEAQVVRPDAVAYTAGPGLIGSLLVGATVARTLAQVWRLPIYPMHHLEGHILSVCVEQAPIAFPFTALLVSGGHSMLLSVEALGEYRILGQSLDDAVGEAFDKTARLLGLSYPGGPAIEALAQKGDETRFTFPRPMCDRPSIDMSFSGLKTAVVRCVEMHGEAAFADIAASFQRAIVDTLIWKCRRALKQTQHQRLVVAGGVAANQCLRKALNSLGVEIAMPKQTYCMDNAAMIAYAACARWQAGLKPSSKIATARWPLESL